jgi:hypothetical protein
MYYLNPVTWNSESKEKKDDFLGVKIGAESYRAYKRIVYGEMVPPSSEACKFKDIFTYPSKSSTLRDPQKGRLFPQGKGGGTF